MFSKLTQSVKNSRHVKVSGRIPESTNFLPVHSGIREKFFCEIWNLGLWNLEYTAKGIQNPIND